MAGQSRSGWNDRHAIDGNQSINALISLFDGDAAFEIDAPRDADGMWWVDCTIGAFATTFAWQHGKGFGLYTSQDDAYGARPDELYREPALAARRLKQLASQHENQNYYTSVAHVMTLKDVRQLLDQPQTYVAQCLGRDQGFVSKLERQHDAKISTMQNYVEALGGRLVLYCKFDGFEAPIDVTSALTQPSRAKSPAKRAQTAKVATTQRSARTAAVRTAKPSVKRGTKTAPRSRQLAVDPCS